MFPVIISLRACRGGFLVFLLFACSRMITGFSPSIPSMPPKPKLPLATLGMVQASSQLTRKYNPTPGDAWQVQINPVMADLMGCIIRDNEGDMKGKLDEYRQYFLMPFAADTEFDVETMDKENVFKGAGSPEERLDIWKSHMEGKIEESDSKILRKLWSFVLEWVLSESTIDR